MKQKDKKIYLSIAGFVVEIVLVQSKHKLLSNEYYRKIIKMFAYFLTHKSNKSDLTLIFSDEKYIVQVNQITIDKGIFIEIAKKNTNTIYNTSYTISTSQLFFLINKMIFDHIAKEDCFTLHASGVYTHDTAYLFTGHSTAGKSTIIQLIQDNQLRPLCDDYGFIRKIGNTFYFYPPGPFERIHTSSPNKKYIIGGMYLIQKSKHFRIKKICFEKKKKDLLGFFQKQITIPQDKKKQLLMDFLCSNKNRVFSLEFEKKKFRKEQIKVLIAPLNA